MKGGRGGACVCVGQQETLGQGATGRGRGEETDQIGKHGPTDRNRDGRTQIGRRNKQRHMHGHRQAGPDTKTKILTDRKRQGAQ